MVRLGVLASLRQRLVGNSVAMAGLKLINSEYLYQNSTLAYNETIFSAVSMLSGAIAALPVAVYKNSRRIEPAEHSVARMLEFGINPNMTTFQFIRCMETLRDSTGAGYAIKELDSNGSIKSLWLMKTSNVTPMIERDSRELYYRIREDLGSKYYTYTIHLSLL